MNFIAAEALFMYLRHQKKGEDLAQVVFEVGDFSTKPYMGPLPVPGWASGRARKFVCEAASDERREGGKKYGHCQLVGDQDPWSLMDEQPELGVATEMWRDLDETAVDDYLEQMKDQH